MSFPNGGQPGQPQQPGQPGQPQQWGQPQTGSHQTWGQAAQSGFNNVKTTSGFDVKNVPWWQWALLGGWVLYIVALSLPALTVEADAGFGSSFSDSASGWNYNAHMFGFILVTLAVLAMVASWFMKAQLSNLGFPFGFVIGGLAALGALLGLIAFIVNITDGESGAGYSVSPGIGTWITLIVLLVIAAAAAFEIMQALKTPKSGRGSGDQWGQPAATGGQWGQPAVGGQPAAGGQWGQPAGGQPAGGQPAGGQWGPSSPQSGGYPAQPQSGGYPAQPQQPGQNPQEPGQGQWGSPQN